MSEDYRSILESQLSARDLGKLTDIDNPKVHQFVADAVALCKPESVLVCDDSAAGMAEIRRQVIENGEERRLAIEGHTIHFDGPSDQGRDRAATKYLVPEGESLSKSLNQTGR